MTYLANLKAVLLLEDGTEYHGRAAGKIGTTTGELCFNTGMTGYQELFTDPSYFGQIMVTTNVHIGNYGVREEESQSDKIMIAGLVCRNFTPQYSRKTADSSIQEFLLRYDLTAISDIDTRAVVNHIRDKGAMNAIISSEELDVNVLKARLSGVPSMAGLELSSKVCTKSTYLVGEEGARHKIAVLDLGVKKNILKNLVSRDAHLKVFPAQTTFSEMSEWQPDAFFISNGPGDPAAMPYAVHT
ncbi:MAG: carbamoyl phosphate synthase small subunit, partial [Bacteroidota bacterium]|nr:carbamoyl phosphate synthase small subunit [Bacteroidota bacterium]